MIKSITTTFSEEELIELIESAINRSPSHNTEIKSIEIIDRKELCNRLEITEPTVIRYEKKGKIPCFRIGSNVRYNWQTVITSLEGKTKGGAK